MLICKFCGEEKKSANSLRNHERLCAANADRVLPKIDYAARNTSNQYIKGTAAPWTDARRAKASETSSLWWTDARRTEQSNKMKTVMVKTVQDHPESYSYKNFCGRSKKTIYNGQLMHSSWELLVAQWLDAHNIKWTRKVPGFKYMWQGTERTYFPDFYLAELDLYIEVKGYETDKDRAKWEVIPGLRIISKKDIKLIQADKYSIRG